MNRSLLRHSPLFYSVCWTLIFAVIIVQTEDAVPIQATGVPENFTDDAGDSVSKNSDSRPVSDDESASNIDSSLGEGGDSTFKQGLQVESASQNSGVSDGFTNGGQSVIYTLQDTATAELQKMANIPNTLTSQNVSASQKSNQTQKPEVPLPEKTEDDNRSDNTEIKTDDVVIASSSESKENLTREEIPSFSEWTQKQLEEAEKKKEQSNSTVNGQSVNGSRISVGKLRSKNYASPDCGAKIVAANPEAVSPSAVLSPSRDEYKLNTCTSRIWFIVELCEAVQAKKIELANFELFSSSPKDFTVSVSDRFPTRDWSIVGQFTAKDERDIQSFDLHPHLFAKYIKVEVRSHYGREHFCPISLFRVYGTSEFEVLEKENQANAADDDDDDETLDSIDGEAPRNLFSSATDAVISIVKKAAEALGNKGNTSNMTVVEVAGKTDSERSKSVSSCMTPSHLVVCDNCSEVLFDGVYELLSCKARELQKLVDVSFIKNILCGSGICETFGLPFKNGGGANSIVSTDYLNAFFPTKYLGALCNTLAVSEKKVVLNSSHQFSNISIKNTPLTEETTESSQYSSNLEPSELVSNQEPEKPTESLNSEASKTTDVPATEETIYPTKVLPQEDDHPENAPIQPTESVKSSQEDVPEALQVNQSESGSTENLTDFDVVTESVESGDDHIEQELGNDGGQSASQSVTPSTLPQVQKESVFLRLSNRIKALERNMSLSTQYLEELSRRYKKQVEEMQRLLDRTLLTLNTESKKKDEKNQQLEEQIKELRQIVDMLVTERNTWGSFIYWICLMTIALFSILTYFRKTPRYKQSSSEPAGEVQRRKSVDVIRHTAEPKKKRRPSEEALKIKGTYEDLLVPEDGPRNGKKRKRKKLTRSNSITTLTEEIENTYRTFHSDIGEMHGSVLDLDWVDQNKLEKSDVPVALEESEHTLPEPVTYQKIDVPDFVKTATDARLNRSVSHTLEPKVNGTKRDTHRKTASLDESKRIVNVNGLGESKSGEGTPKKERKGLKKIFKKVF